MPQGEDLKGIRIRINLNNIKIMYINWLIIDFGKLMDSHFLEFRMSAVSIDKNIERSLFFLSGLPNLTIKDKFFSVISHDL